MSDLRGGRNGNGKSLEHRLLSQTDEVVEMAMVSHLNIAYYLRLMRWLKWQW